MERVCINKHFFKLFTNSGFSVLHLAIRNTLGCLYLLMNLSILAENFDVVRYSVFKEQIFKQLSLLSGDKGIRTLDPLLARQVLSQLSYTPIDPATTYSPISSPT